MKKAVMYGAGNIGRGFIGQMFHKSGYEVVFIDVNPAVITSLNEQNGYPIVIASEDELVNEWVENVSAVDGKDTKAVSRVIADADIMATAVGANILKWIAEPIAIGLELRWQENVKEPLNILLCENLMNAGSIMEKLIKTHISHENLGLFKNNVGLVETSIGRMVPVMTKERQKENPLCIWVEPYDQIPLDKKAFKGDIPKLVGAILYTPFKYYVEKKLYIHNMGHAMVAYMGQLYNYELISEAVKDPIIRKMVVGAMNEVAEGLSKHYNTSITELQKHIDDLISRFENPYLGDTIERVGADPLRKLLVDDRLIGAGNYCIREGVSPVFISMGIACALLFKDKNDTKFIDFKEKIKRNGVESALQSINEAKMDRKLASYINHYYDLFYYGIQQKS